ncbi:MAG: hypothetical protein ABUK01_11095 [Leptospirales bacterium]
MKNILFATFVFLVSFLFFGTLNAQASTLDSVTLMDTNEKLSSSVEVKAIVPIREFCGGDEDEDKDDVK